MEIENVLMCTRSLTLNLSRDLFTFCSVRILYANEDILFLMQGHIALIGCQGDFVYLLNI